MEWLLSSLERARQKFEAPCEFPLIDDGEILDQKTIYESWPWEYGDRKYSRDSLMEVALASDHADLPVRFTWLNFFYRLANYPADEVASVIEDRDNAAWHRKEFLGDLKTLVGLAREQAIESRDPRRIRWEISNACVIKDWDLAEILYGRLEELAEVKEKPTIFAMHGRHEFLTVFAPRWELDELDLDMWAPMPSRPLTGVLNLLLSRRSVAVAGSVVASPTADENSRTEGAAYYLAKAIKGDVKNDLNYRCLLLRCRVALAQFREAAAECELLLKRRDEFSSGRWAVLELELELEPSIISNLYELAVYSYEADGQIDRAIAASDRWLQEFPDQPGIHERRSRLFQRQGDLDAAYTSLRKEVERNPLRGENPDISMALRFGELYGSPDVQWRRFRQNLDPIEIELIRVLVTIHWPNARKLDDHNFKEWVDGCCLLLKHMPDNPTMAASTFGRLAEAELRARVFDRFRATMRSELGSISSGENDPLTNYIRGRGISLEQMLNEIRFRDARSTAGRRFREWLGREKNTGLLQRMDLKSLGELNNRAKHRREPFLEWKDAEEIVRLARELLDVVLSI